MSKAKGSNIHTALPKTTSVLLLTLVLSNIVEFELYDDRTAESPK